MPSALESFLADHEAEILAAWESRVLVTRPGDPKPDPPPDRDHVRARVRTAFGDVRAALQRGVPGAGAAEHLHAHAHELAPAETMLALVTGRDVIRECMLREVPADEAAGQLAALGDAFQQLFAAHGPAGCSRCLSAQEDSRARVQRRLETVVEHALDAIVLCDRHGVIEAWNRGATDLLDRSALEALGKSLTVLVPPAGAGAWLASVLARVDEQGHARFPETVLVRRTGEPVWVDASFSSVRDPAGHSIGLWAVFRDMTEQRRLVEDNLQAERLALIGTMSAKFAHEIRNPLASILLNLDLIRDSLDRRTPVPAAAPGTPAEDEELVGSIAREVERIQSVVQEYLRFARLPQAQRHPVRLDEALGRGLAMLEPELKQRGVRLALALDDGGRPVSADADQVWQAVMNLVRNAMEAVPRGGCVTVSTRGLADGVECVVADDGPGIAPEVQERIFVPFFSTKHAGTGLGLPFVRQVLAEHHVALHLDSAPGRGAHFSFVLPHADGD